MPAEADQEQSMPERGKQGFDGPAPPEPVAVTNGGRTTLFVGGVMIPPGETRHFPPNQVPTNLREIQAAAVPVPPAAPPAQEDNLLELLDKNTAEIAAKLPGLSSADLARLKAAEDAGKTRKGVMAALAEEELRRAQQAEDDNAG